MKKILVVGLIILLTNWNHAQTKQFTYTATGDQTYTVPTGVTAVKVYMWGAGGGGGDITRSSITHGGGGGFVKGTLCVKSGDNLKIIVGQGGGYGKDAVDVIYGGGGKGGGGQKTNEFYTGAGGGRSAIRKELIELATAGGGGGGGETRNIDKQGNERAGVGGAGGGVIGRNGAAYGFTVEGTKGGRGGTSLSGGAGGVYKSGYNGSDGSQYQGGAGNKNNDREGGGGGGGYFGGGGGAGNDDAQSFGGGGGGGGSSYIGGLIVGSALSMSGGSGDLPASQQVAANSSFIYYMSDIATGGGPTLPGKPGMVFIVPITVTAISTSHTICENTAFTSITHNSTGATGIATATGLPPGLTAVWASGPSGNPANPLLERITISGTPTTSGTFFYSIPLTGTNECGGAALVATGTITVNPTTVGGTVTSAQNICSGTSPINLTLSGQTGTIVRWERSADPTFNSDVTSISNTTTTLPSATIGNLSVNTYFRAVVKSGVCAIVNSAPVLITVNPTSVGGSVSSAQTICTGTSPANLTLSGQTGTVVKWQRATDINFTENIEEIHSATTTLSGAAIGNLNANTYFRAVVQSGVCAIVNSAPVLITVNSIITPTFTTVLQAQTCADEHITYATQTGQSNYVWTVSGAVGVDYNLIARGTNTNHDIVVEWLTAGNKTVSVNYSNAQGCSAATPATYSTEVFVIDQGRVKGGGEFCEGTALPLLTLYSIAGDNISYPNPALVLKWQQSDDENITWIDIPDTKGKVNYTPTVFPGAFRTYRVILQNGPCSKTAIESRVTIKTVTAPLLGAITQPTCISSISSVVLTGLPSSGTIIQTGSVSATYSITGGGSQIISGLSAGTYKFAVQSESCSSNTTSEVVISPVTNTWNGTSWSDAGKLPTTGQDIVFAGDYTSTGDLEGCSCIVNTGKTVVFTSVGVTSGHTLKITNKVEVLGTGSLTMENNTNLIQVNDVVNSGNITVIRNTTPRRNDDGSYSAKEYSFYAAPVKDQNMKAIFGGSVVNSAFALVLNEPKNNFVNASAANYGIPGKGFAVKDPTVKYINDIANPINAPAVFKGIPNNGKIEISVTKTGTLGWNLIGNPYPSNLDLKSFYDDNVFKIDATIRFWDKRVNATYVQYGGAYNGYSYALYNAKSDVGNPAPGGDDGDNTGTPGDNTTTGVDGQFRYAKVGQGFLIRSLKAADTVYFYNNRRIAVAGDGFFGKNAKAEDRNLYRIQLVTPGNLALTQSVVYFRDGNHNFGADDSKHPASSSSDAFYSYSEEEKVIINGRSSFSTTDVLNLGLRNFVSGIYRIRAVDLGGVFANGQPIYLKDNQLGILSDLTVGEYSFNSASGEFTNRFEIVYQPEIVLGIDAIAKAKIQFYRDAQDFVVKSSTKKILSYELYDMSGRILRSQKTNSKEIRFNAENLVEGTYLFNAKMEDGENFVKKLRR